MRDLKQIKRNWRRHLQVNKLEKTDIEIGLSGTFTLDPLTPYLGGALLEENYKNPLIKIADYNQTIQTCLSPETAFGAPLPDVIALLWRLEDLAEITDATACQTAAELLFDAIDSLRESYEGLIILCAPPLPTLATDGLVGFSQPGDMKAVWHQVTARFFQRFSAQDRMQFIDLNASLTNLGANSHDARKYYLYKQPYSEALYADLAPSIVRIIRARSLEAKKCLVLDCDNTLWGGIIGEDGLDGIQVSDDFPGNVFKIVQQQIKVLQQSGIFVALNSKNNTDDVWAVFDNHDAMALSKNEISVSRINWQPKSQNLKEIAKELNIGLDSLIFIDDNPFEIAEVQANAPEVTCLQVPEELTEYPALLKDHAGLFDRLVITDDDIKRVERMKSEQLRTDTAQSLTQEDFLAQLELKVFVYEPETADLARVTQLINKTNQFNCMTRRFTHEEVVDFISDSNNQLFCMSVSDKFGEYGLVGVAMLSDNNGEWFIRNLLMSCRVLGRGVETTLLSHIGNELAGRNGRRLRGGYAPTPKNKLVENLFEDHGFSRASDPVMGPGVSEWLSDIPLKKAKPDYVELLRRRP